MEIKDYTVVSCNNCEEVWIVEGNPEQSQCPRCEKTRRFKLLKKYRSYDDIEKARLVRAKVKASIAGDDEEFDAAASDGKILVDDEEIFGNTRFSSNKTTSFEETVREAIEKFDSIEEVIDYAEQEDHSEERVREYISKKKIAGEIIQSNGSIRFV